MKSISLRVSLTLFICCTAITVTGCPKPVDNVVDGATEDDVAEYNRMVAEEMAGYEEGAKAAKEGGAK